MPDAVARPPHRPRLDAELAAGAALADDAVLDGVLITDWDEGSARTEFVELSRSRVDGGTVADSSWRRASVVDCRFDGLDAANSEWIDSGWSRVEAAQCRLTGIRLPGATIADVRFTDCLLEFANLRFAKFTRCAFDRCRLGTADFVGAQLENVSFVDCDLAGAGFANARTTRTSFAGCRLDGLTGVESLRGATIDPLDLFAITQQLAAALGITIAS